MPPIVLLSACDTLPATRERIAEALKGDADLEELYIDSTVARAHQHAAGAPKKTLAIRRSAGRAAD